MATANTPQLLAVSTANSLRTSRRGTRPHRVATGQLHVQEERVTRPEGGLAVDERSVNNHANGGSSTCRPANTAPRTHFGSTESAGTEDAPAETVQSGNPLARGERGRGRNGRRVTGRGRNTGNTLGQSAEALAVASSEQSASRNQSRASYIPNGRTSVHNSRRQFGGRLTTTNETSSSTFSLQGDATVFVPGQQHCLRPRTSRKTPTDIQGEQQYVRREPKLKSTKPDIATRTHEDILNGLYECPICTSEVLRNSRVWSCKTCWTVFHLTCISTWAKNDGSTHIQHRYAEDELPQPRQWRCPGCNLPKDTLPTLYTCWCEKEADPRSISGLPPHSCGQTCGKQRLLPKECPHPCELLCHAGPCPPCTHLGPIQSCFCGKKSTSRRCVDTDYVSGWSCGEVCGDPMPCGEHTCQRPCHEGLCGACETKIDCCCYCGNAKKSLVCYEKGENKESRMLQEADGVTRVVEWTGSFECGTKCQRPFDCGKHSCDRFCHSRDIGVPHCPLSPDVVSHCPCGKTPLSELLQTSRQSCEDPIPNCDKECLKQLACGHACQQICHANACMPCSMIVTVACRCGRVQSRSLCHQGEEAQPQCLRTCKATLNCGRHECGERCCPGERKAADRQATKRKLRPLGASRVIDEGFEAEHICTRQCGRPLKCGNHICRELCHKGPCGSCREAIFEDFSCRCGKTVIQPPLPCGTVPPKCRFECERPKSCGHPRVPHNCHGDEDTCPKCPFLAMKPCMCGKKALKNQPCWLSDVRCGEACGQKLRCGSHFCRNLCHRPGECEDADRPCQQSCGKAKKICGHPCEEPCHAPSACHEDKPCQNKMLVTCSCQHLKQEFKCAASKTSDGNFKKMLDCNGECARLERNRQLALALNIDPEAHKDDHIPYSNETLKLFRENTKWAQTQERQFRVFAADESQKRLRFKPMPSNQRAFLHALSDDFGFDSESMDPEPHRHVAVFKTPRFVMAPMKTLAECVRIRNSVEASNIALLNAEKKFVSNNTPYNGFVLTNPRFGLTLEELRHDFSSVLSSVPGVAFDISFLPNEEIVLKARPATSSTIISNTSIEAGIKAVKPSLSAITSSRRLANSIQLCALDDFLNLSRRELDASATRDGWSQVAAKGVPPRSAPRQAPVGEKSVYTVLGSRLKDVKKKKETEKARQDETVVEDWEEEVRREEAAKEDAGGSDEPMIRAQEVRNETSTGKETRGE